MATEWAIEAHRPDGSIYEIGRCPAKHLADRTADYFRPMRAWSGKQITVREVERAVTPDKG